MQKPAIRLAKHAGSWYNKNKQKLDAQLTDYLSRTSCKLQNIKTLKAVIGPHAGFAYSGPVAAWAYRYFQNLKPRRVFLLGPSHHSYFQGCALTEMEQYETPLGNIPIDKEIVQKLQKEGKFQKLSKKAEEAEHSLEMHLPYIRKSLGQETKLIPIMVGNVDNKAAQYYGKLLAKYFDEQDTVFIISSDFCHWGPHFDYQPYQKGVPIHQHIQKLDRTGMSLIQKNDLQGFSSYIQKTGNTICGEHPIRVLMATIKHSKYAEVLKTKFVQYDQSERVKAMNGSSVSYASAVIYVPV